MFTREGNELGWREDGTQVHAVWTNHKTTHAWGLWNLQLNISHALGLTHQANFPRPFSCALSLSLSLSLSLMAVYFYSYVFYARSKYNYMWWWRTSNCMAEKLRPSSTFTLMDLKYLLPSLPCKHKYTDTLLDGVNLPLRP